jgi:hypothetical protein
MAFASAQKARLAIGSLNYSGYTRGFSAPITVDMLDVTTIVDTSMSFIPGLDTASFSLDFLLDSDGANTDWGQMYGWKSTQPQPATLAFQGFTTGLDALLVNLDEAEFTVNTAPNAAVAGSISAQATGQIDVGYMVEDFTAIVATGNGTARNFTASSANGAVFHLHVSAFASLTSDTITIEDSANGSSGWATIATFTAATAVTYQRLAITGTVRQYLRVVDTFSGSGSITRAVAFARR